MCVGGISDGSCVRSSVFLKKKTKQNIAHLVRPVLLQNAAAKPIGCQDQTEEAGQVGCLQHFLRYTGVGLGGRKWADAGRRPLLDRGDGIVDGLGDVVDVLGGQAAHVDATAGHQVHVLLFDHVVHLLAWRTHHNSAVMPWIYTLRTYIETLWLFILKIIVREHLSPHPGSFCTRLHRKNK